METKDGAVQKCKFTDYINAIFYQGSKCFLRYHKTSSEMLKTCSKTKKRKLKLYNKSSFFSTKLVIFARDAALIQLFPLSLLILKLLWGIRIRMMSIEQLSLDNRHELAFVFSWETSWDYVILHLFLFLPEKWMAEVSK